MQSRVPKYNGDPHGPDGKLLSNFIPFAVLKSQNRRIYNDEVTRPDARFCHARMLYFRNKMNDAMLAVDSAWIAADVWRCWFERLPMVKDIKNIFTII